VYTLSFDNTVRRVLSIVKVCGGDCRATPADASLAAFLPAMTTIRCSWPRTELDIRYHDEEWGVPVHDDRVLFEFLILEGAQAGLSWSTILNKREHYRDALDGFDPARVARYTTRKLDRLLTNPGLVRNRLKIRSLPINARAFLETAEEFGSFDAYLWRFVNGHPVQNRRRALAEVPARTPESDAMSKDLLKRGFKFVGSTICYAYMQAVGLVNDHVVTCFRHAEVQRGASARS
jgi:DNA-3-methyladenine glycosylase I